MLVGDWSTREGGKHEEETAIRAVKVRVAQDGCRSEKEGDAGRVATNAVAEAAFAAS